MAQQGIMALPMGGDMQNDQQQDRLQVSSAESYDAAKTALGMIDPQSLAVMRESLRQNIAELDLSAEEIDAIIGIFEYMTQRPDQYPKLVKELEQRGVLDAGDLPEDYDPSLIGIILSLLNEMRQMRAETAIAPMQMGPGAAPMGMAEGGLADVAQYLATKGRHGDTMLAHITPEEAQILKRMGGSGTINPETGLPEFFLGKVFQAVGNIVSGVVKSVVNVAKKVLASPIGKVAATVGLAMVLGPTAIGATLGQAGTAALASGAVTLAGGGNLKQALVSGALGYIGGGGDFGGLGSPIKGISGILPEGFSPALKTGLATGALGAGAGLALGMRPVEALKMGATSGLISGALQGLSGGQRSTAEQPAQPSAGPGPIGQAGSMVSAGGAGAPGAVSAVGPVGTAGDYLSSGDAQALQQAAARESADFVRFQGGENVPGRAFLGVQPQAPGTPGAIQPPGLFDRAIQGAKDIYSEYLSPDRPGLPSDAGLLRRYAPLAAVGTGLAMAAGATKSKPAEPSPLGFDDQSYITESRRRADERTKQLEDIGYGWRPAPVTSGSTFVPTPSFSTLPIGNIPTTMPVGITQSPGGIAQPYNVAGLYGVPLLYGQPQGRAKGGEMTMQDFPRKTGPINGPGTGTSDTIPAMLSDGEFVFTAKAVRNAGNGSRRKGAARMYKLMKMLEGGPVKGK